MVVSSSEVLLFHLLAATKRLEPPSNSRVSHELISKAARNAAIKPLRARSQACQGGIISAGRSIY